MPNQPKTPITSFRLDEETKERIRRMAEGMGTTMTEAVTQATARASAAMEALSAAIKDAGLDSTRYPFEAYSEGMMAYRETLEIGPGEILPQEVSDVVQAVIAASWPIICADKIDDERRRTLVDTIQRLEGFEQGGDVSPDVVKHFWGLLNAHDEAHHADTGSPTLQP